MIHKENAQNKLVSNAVSGIMATLVYMLSRLLLTPFILHYLSLSEFGLWSLCFIILSYAGMGGFGVNSTYIRYAARYLAEGREQEISRLLSTGVAYMFLFCSLFYAGLYFSMPFLMVRFNIEAAQRAVATTLILGTAIVFSIELVLGGFRFIINGMHEFAKERMVTTVAGLIEIGAIIGFLALGSGVKGLLYAYALRLVLETLGCWFIAKSLLPSLRVSLRLFSREHLRHFFGFGGKVQVLGMLGIFLTAIDRLFITAISGLAAGGLFEIGRKLPSAAGGISSSAFGPFLSTAAHLEGNWTGDKWKTPAERAVTYLMVALASVALASAPIAFLDRVRALLPVNSWIAALVAAGAGAVLLAMLDRSFKTENRLDSDELKKLYLDGIRFTNIINSLLFGFLIAMARPLIDVWVGTKYPGAAEVMIFLSIAYSIQLCTGPVTLLFRGIDRNGRELEYMLAQTLLMVLWIPAGTTVWGLTGAAAAIAASMSASTLFLIWRSNGTFAIRTGEFVTHSVLPALIPIVPGVLIFTISTLWPQTGRLNLMLQIVACGTFFVLSSAGLLWKFVLDEAEKSKAFELLPLKKGSA
ncbi:polysaccharide biosynthesis protein [Chlorobaculum thiosulfatiphilum]|uniref:Polysaccharide biosynthesis protein n=1 Tax=Chlorobaculum thiosulfatiphilum TaxID=115852 RepID=A0A5C4S809_CHLTI|nr:oligosaccharide flippase family protein [Chlorobaculum thiosulfatiphilum]TNJ39288.1 polysaccharide biosynthesis protein [Chlorobaculum thiosulfatiphilum]